MSHSTLQENISDITSLKKDILCNFIMQTLPFSFPKSLHFSWQPGYFFFFHFLFSTIEVLSEKRYQSNQEFGEMEKENILKEDIIADRLLRSFRGNNFALKEVHAFRSFLLK